MIGSGPCLTRYVKRKPNALLIGNVFRAIECYGDAAHSAMRRAVPGVGIFAARGQCLNRSLRRVNLSASRMDESAKPCRWVGVWAGGRPRATP